MLYHDRHGHVALIEHEKHGVPKGQSPISIMRGELDFEWKIVRAAREGLSRFAIWHHEALDLRVAHLGPGVRTLAIRRLEIGTELELQDQVMSLISV